MELVKAKYKGEVEGIKECIDLLHNGYFILFSSGADNDMYYKLRHRSNGRMLSMRINKHGYTIKEGLRLVKKRIVPVALISD